MYRCPQCGKQFHGGKRIDGVKLWNEYVHDRRTVRELALSHGCNERTVRRHLSFVADGFVPYDPTHAVVIMDTTYFGRGFGVSIFLDAASGKVLHRKYVKNETNADYIAGLEAIRSNGTSVSAVVCDGRTGLLASFSGLPSQMCQFHQLQIVRRLLTSKPKLPAGKELLELCRRMKTLGKSAFTAEFSAWCERWHKFLAERTTLASGRTTYTHRRLRAARRSVMAHLPWLFTYEDFPTLGIPRTTNRLEGVNSLLKRSMVNHNGLNGKNRIKFIDSFLRDLNMKAY